MINTDRLTSYMSLRQFAAKADSAAKQPANAEKDDATLFFEVAVSLASLDLDVLCHEIVKWGCQLVNTSHGFIYVVNQQEEVLELKYGTGIYARYTGVKRGKQEPSVSSVVWRTGQAVAVDHLVKWEGKAKDRPYGWDVVRSVLGLPLYSEYEVVAVVGLGFNVDQRIFTERELDMLSRFAALASLALNNAQLFNSLKESHQQADLVNSDQTVIPSEPEPYGQELLMATSQGDSPEGEQKNHSEIVWSMWQAAQSHLTDAFLASHEGIAIQSHDAVKLLTEREQTVLKLMAAGLSNREIALKIGVEVSTIKTHANRLFAKLGVKRRVQALILARESGLI